MKSTVVGERDVSIIENYVLKLNNKYQRTILNLYSFSIFTCYKLTFYSEISLNQFILLNVEKINS